MSLLEEIEQEDVYRKDLIALLLKKFKKVKSIPDESVDDEGETVSKDDLYAYAIETAIDDVLNFCHITITEIPVQLYNTIIMMAGDIYAQATLSEGDLIDIGDTKLVSEGDFKYQKETRSEVVGKILNMKSFAQQYYRILSTYRRTLR